MSKGKLDLLKNSRKADLNVQVLIKIQTSREKDKESDFCSAGQLAFPSLAMVICRSGQEEGLNG